MSCQTVVPLTLGQRIQVLRKQKGFTQAQLAQGLCDPLMIEQTETDIGRPSFTVLNGIAERLEVPFDSFMVDSQHNKECVKLFHQGMKHQQDRDYLSALECFEELVKRPFIGSIPKNDLLVNLAVCYLCSGQPMEATDWFYTALESAYATQDLETVVAVYKFLGHIEFQEQRFEHARRHFDRALALCGRLPEVAEYETTTLLILIGLCHFYMENSKDAMQIYRHAEDICQSDPERTTLCFLQLMLSRVYAKMSKSWEAQLYLEKSVTLLHEIGVIDDERGIRTAWANFLDTCSAPIANACLRSIAEFLDQNGYQVEAGLCYVELANSYLISDQVFPPFHNSEHRGHVELAMDACREAELRLAESVLYLPFVQEIRGRVLVTFPDLDQAAMAIRKAADGFKQQKLSKHWERMMNALSTIYCAQEGNGDTQESIGLTIRAKPELVNVRVLAGFSQRDLARKTGLSSPFLSQLEKGIRNAGPHSAKKICDTLEVDFEDVFELVKP
ncbi:tetratricopeptide repeat protein [Tumebacillus permanentifrigoris]|uniref:Tetratricopeptide repeat protein n=1 Tax=Tumebacillus permanentifrigoris TaxID=378543 RepID=A0A316D6J3_9BACL|nr:tetratricopeptide repeat protein [Tumebacillus permanentifrigoris]PWK07045.1 tetratricopeptide repeat protein [Tumebacillus permanentifrigoris]